MSFDIRNVKDMRGLIQYFSEDLDWRIDLDDFIDIEDITYDFDAGDIGLKEEAFAKIASLRQLQPLVDQQKWGIFCVEFDSNKFEVSALRKILSGLVPKRRNAADHAVWSQKDLLFICLWGTENNTTIGLAHFEDKESGLPQIKMISCAPAAEDFTQIRVFESRLAKLAWPKDTSDHESWRTLWSDAFITGYRQTIHDSATLTVQLAAEAQNIRNRILDILEVESENGYVHLLYEKFKNTLIHDMTEQQFADMYAQTVVYGLFSARCMDESQDDFSAAEAIECIPSTNPFLKSLMRECLGSQESGKLSFDELEIGNVVDLLVNTRTDSIIQDFNRQTGGGKEDPVIHFYEEFLTAYDKEQKVQRGVFYTPQPVVNFIVKAIDFILKSDFGMENGLASTETKKVSITRQSLRRIDGFYRDVEEDVEVPAIQILDPATGTGTFLRQTILQIYENFKEAHKGEKTEELEMAWNEYVPKHLLPRLNGFELMMAPYAVAHMKLAMVLKDTGYHFFGDTRLNVYLTNSLEEPGNSSNQLTIWDDPLAVESVEANGIKKNQGINIVLGNPPYSGESSNKSEWILKLIEDYKVEPGGTERLQEKNSKWLSDDYVKFIRYAQTYIDRSSSGILAYICPHGFLDNPTFRGMRWNLLKAFERIYILNLHGNSKKHETCPDGSKDENVFDIMQGVCIILAIKGKTRNDSLAEVYYEDCYGTRDVKYNYLTDMNLNQIEFKKVEMQFPALYFVPKDFSLKSEYDEGISVTDVFVLQSAGMVTARDSLTLHDDPKKALLVAQDFMKMEAEAARVKYNLGKDVQDWKVEWAQQDLRETTINGVLDESKLCRVAYRCFDSKYSYYTGKSRGFYCRPRQEVMKYMVNTGNIGFVTVNRQPEQNPVGYYFVADGPVSNGYIRSDSVSIDTVFPLFVFSEDFGKEKRSANLSKSAISKFEKATGLSYRGDVDWAEEPALTPYSILAYIYGVLYSPQYREKYAEYLKLEYPKVPMPKDASSFMRYGQAGKRLIELHLMQNEEDFASVDTDYPFIGDGSAVVEKTPASSYKDKRVYINKTQYFDNVPHEVWEMYIGGYQPLQKWLKDKKQVRLSEEQTHHFSKVIHVLRETITIMKKIEEISDF